jgi:glutamate formiminotransferase/formiminotetrahydrofolate cyclodeaminase
MADSLIECIPNFSEARRPEVVAAIVAAMQAVPGACILDQHSDLDHNRTVVTLIGAPAAVQEAAFQAIQKAGLLIDLNQHTGAHPRIGATDVVPFVPIRDVTMQECIELARGLAQRVAGELNIPVYLYEEAALRPERKNLEDIRRGEFEVLKAEMGVNPARDPDYGPHQVGPAGATVIGARHPLIAFNVYLTTDDVAIASQIARTVRHSSGGLRYVKAMGVLVDGRAQVSMNLTNFHQSPIHRVVEMIRREAARYGVAIHHSELVGLIPQDALVDSAVWHLQLDGFSAEQILEQRMTQATLSTPVEAEAPGFLDELSRGTPTPGGGSASAFAGASAAALVAMVARLTLGKKKYAAVESLMWTLIEQADALRQELTIAIEQDAAAFDEYLAAVRLPRETSEQLAHREQALQAATQRVIQVPLQVAHQAVEVLGLAQQVAAKGNLNAISDAGTAAALAQAALSGAGLNVRLNCQSLADPVAAQDFGAQIAALDGQAALLADQIKRALAERAKLTL